MTVVIVDSLPDRMDPTGSESNLATGRYGGSHGRSHLYRCPGRAHSPGTHTSATHVSMRATPGAIGSDVIADHLRATYCVDRSRPSSASHAPPCTSASHTARYPPRGWAAASSLSELPSTRF